MKKLLLFSLILGLMASCKKENWESETIACTLSEDINAQHPKSAQLKVIMDHYTSIGLSGVSIALHDEDGYWAGASGYAKIEDQTALSHCHLLYSQSVAKTYLAVAVMQLEEADMIELDNSIDTYLSREVLDLLPDVSEITVEMLLNHTSGLPEYNQQADYVTYLFQHPLEPFTPMNYLELIEGKKLTSKPGTDYRYTNTNYVLLAMMVDGITGDHARFIRSNIFHYAGLENSHYHNNENFLENDLLVNSYWDRYSNGVIENCSEMQKTNVKTLIGDDGIIATPLDYVKFSKSLFENKLVSEKTLNRMLKNGLRESDDYLYGYGIHESVYKGKKEHGHSGGGIGAGCYLAYFPETKTHLFIGINMGTIIHSPLFDDLEQMVDEIFDEAIR